MAKKNDFIDRRETSPASEIRILDVARSFRDRVRSRIANNGRKDEVYVTHCYTVPQARESAVVIGVRDYNRLLERLDALKSQDWSELWLAVAGAGAALAVSALVGALTLSASLSGTINVLWALTAAGSAVFCLCVIGYLTQQRGYKKGICELKRDLEMLKPDADVATDLWRHGPQ